MFVLVNEGAIQACLLFGWSLLWEAGTFMQSLTTWTMVLGVIVRLYHIFGYGFVPLFSLPQLVWD